MLIFWFLGNVVGQRNLTQQLPSMSVCKRLKSTLKGRKPPCRSWIRWLTIRENLEFVACARMWATFEAATLLFYTSDDLDPCRPCCFSNLSLNSQMFLSVVPNESLAELKRFRPPPSSFMVACYIREQAPFPHAPQLPLTNLNKFNKAAVLWLSHCNNVRNSGCPSWVRAT